MPIVSCKICKTKFYAKPFWVARGFGKYCSANCQHIGRRNGRIVLCEICGKEVYKPGRALRHSKSGKHFCGRSCQTKWRNIVFVGKRHANWRTGRFAYKTVLRRHKIPEICGLCRTKDGRVLATHHIDGNNKNHSLKNLMWLCHNCHFLIHHYDEERKKLMVPIV